MTQCQGWLRKFGSKGEFSDTRSAEGMHNIPAGPCFWAQSDSTFASRNKEDPESKSRKQADTLPGPPHDCQHEIKNGLAPIQQTTGKDNGQSLEVVRQEQRPSPSGVGKGVAHQRPSRRCLDGDHIKYRLWTPRFAERKKSLRSGPQGGLPGRRPVFQQQIHNKRRIP